MNSNETVESCVINPNEHEGVIMSEPQESSEIRLSPAVEALVKELENLPSIDAKLQRVIQFMEEGLSQGKVPNFKSFWQARDLALKYFKEHVSPQVRLTLWTKYSELSKEARRLKELLDEQSAFAAEQIDIAIKGLENDISSISNNADVSYSFPVACQFLEKNQQLYGAIQNELNLLNSYASKINALRKELVQTEMRIRKKNQFFQRLSSAGDKIFPRRRELIQEVSQQFQKDVEDFVAAYFTRTASAPSFVLRDEIKAFQSIAKELTLNSPTFVQTRARLSECWDKVKELDKERKKERAQQHAVFEQNRDQMLEKLNLVSQEFQENKLNVDEAQQRLGLISKELRNVELGREEIAVLRNRLEEVRELVLEKVKADQEKRAEQEKERQRQKEQRLTTLKDELKTLVLDAPSFQADQLAAARDSALERIQSAGLTKVEKQDLEKLLKPLRDLIAEKKEQALLALPENERQELQQLHEILKQRKERRQEIKNQIESLRKAKGGSGMDFEKAMEFNAQLNEEKDRLEKINQGIEEIEEKIGALTKD